MAEKLSPEKEKNSSVQKELEEAKMKDSQAPKEDPEEIKKVEEEEITEDSGDNWWASAGNWMNTSVLEKAVSSVTSATSSAVQVAKDKSNEVYGLVSKDLNEVSTQASSAVGSAASTVKRTLEEFDDKTDELADKAYEGVKKSVSSFWKYASGYAQQMFTEEDLASQAMVIKDSNPVLMDRLQAQLFALASDPDTFKSAPVEEEFKNWECDLDKREGEIADLMMANPTVRQHYTELVPEHVSHKVFWMRYFFKVHLIELQEAKRQVLKKRAEKTRLDSDSEINWDDVGDIGSPGEPDAIPDDIQDKLLSDYERELITEKLKKGEEGKKKQSLSQEIDNLNLKSDDGSGSSPESSFQEKESIASDDWEKLSFGEKSPKKTSREDETDWVKP